MSTYTGQPRDTCPHLHTTAIPKKKVSTLARTCAKLPTPPHICVPLKPRATLANPPTPATLLAHAHTCTHLRTQPLGVRGGMQKYFAVVCCAFKLFQILPWMWYDVR